MNASQAKLAIKPHISQEKTKLYYKETEEAKTDRESGNVEMIKQCLNFQGFGDLLTIHQPTNYLLHKKSICFASFLSLVFLMALNVVFFLQDAVRHKCKTKGAS